MQSAAAIRRIAVAFQLAGALLCAAGLVKLWSWPWPAALLGGVGIVVALFGLGVALAFAASLRGFGIDAQALPQFPPAALAARARVAPLSRGEALRCYVSEAVAVFRMFNWLQPLRAGQHFVTDGADPRLPPVLLVHGYGCNHAVWLDMQPALAAAGYRCEAIDLEPVFGDIDHYGQALRERIESIAARGQPPLVLCHSMGGLAVRSALASGRRDGRPIPCAGIVTLGTPHHGCALARFGGGRNARQMRIGSPWLRALAATESERDRATWVSIFSWHDSISGPAGTAWLEGADNMPFAGIGHVSLLRDARVAAAAIRALDRLAAISHALATRS